MQNQTQFCQNASNDSVFGKGSPLKGGKDLLKNATYVALEKSHKIVPISCVLLCKIILRKPKLDQWMRYNSMFKSIKIWSTR